MFRKKDFYLVMHHASFNGALIVKPSWGLIGELTLDDDGMRCWSEEKKLVLGTQDKESTLTPWSNYTDTFVPPGASATVVSVPELSHPHSPDTDSVPGIPELEKAARAVRENIRTKRLHDTSKSPFDKVFTEEERIELTTRLLVRAMNG